MKRFILLRSAVVLSVMVVASGCASSHYDYKNKGMTTEVVKRTADGGFERTTSYENEGSGTGSQSPSPYYDPYGNPYRGSVGWRGGADWNVGWDGWSGGSPAVIVPGPSTRQIQSMLPQPEEGRCTPTTYDGVW